MRAYIGGKRRLLARGDERTSGRRPLCCVLPPMRPRSARTPWKEYKTVIVTVTVAATATATATATVSIDRTKDTPSLRTVLPRFRRQ